MSEPQNKSDAYINFMKPFDTFPDSIKKKIRFVLTDIDDTLTIDGQLPSVALAAMERLQAANIIVIPITGRPAGWCDHMARMWPIDALVGENGAFYFYYDRQNKRMVRSYWRTADQRLEDRSKLRTSQQLPFFIHNPQLLRRIRILKLRD